MRHVSRFPLWLLALAGALAVPAIAMGALRAGGEAAAQPTVHLRGTAYEFNNVRKLLAGATIRVAELPRLKAVVRRNGTYDLAVPDRARITPYIRAAGHHTIYLQTFTTGGEDLANVNFQTPTEDVYRALVALLNVPVDEHGELVDCAVVSTFNTKNVRDLGYAGFIAYGAHGVAGATATGRPTLPKPDYFNESVVPDPAQRDSSKDGGVVWTRVPAGVYTITAHSPRTRFASFAATCRPGRVVNANPPWGLHELAPPNPARVAATWSLHGSRIALRSLTVRALPRKAVVRAACSGPGCPFARRTFAPAGAGLDLRRALGAAASRLRAGQTLEVAVSAHAFNGTVVRWRIGTGRAPAPTTLCVPLGNTLPRRRC